MSTHTREYSDPSGTGLTGALNMECDDRPGTLPSLSLMLATISEDGYHEFIFTKDTEPQRGPSTCPR